ncbi:U4/U6.U5 tri-snRNP-associated protein 1 [Protopterus annectens]|uniref:U4/U6.U5 tri-snRNP-associated protein 1 n=1 Tax=Protopterus annectens TaxID=7888 RepID=UPI001CFB3094|nr:U4/U6.U5 tri-snRNP-associated protein 1 [Protopterus annectens]
MGSSKKHKEKDRSKDQSERHREHKKHKHREKDRERRKRSRSKSSERQREKKRNSEKDSRRAVNEVEKKIKKEKPDSGYEEASGSRSAAGDTSLSIEETNKLRAKLGLKPLEVNEVKKEVGTKEDPKVAQTINPVILKQQEELREKLAAAKEKRLLNQKLGKVKSLGDDDWLDDTVTWIQKSRKIQQERDMADRRAKLLQEMDEEFGISHLVEEEFAQLKRDSYTAHDLHGLTVEHALDSFREGENFILTLKDRGVLDEEDDVLINVNLVDKEKARKNVELRKKKFDYKPYEEEESVDDMVNFRHKSVLSKYDEEIEGEKKKKFMLESGGTADGTWEKELQQIRENLRNRAQNLEMPKLKMASEFYTEEEMETTFKKTKRRVKKIRKKIPKVKADDLLKLGDASSHADYGSRKRGRGRRHSSDEEDYHTEDRKPNAEGNIPFFEQPESDDMDISEDEEAKGPDFPVVIEEDEAELELQKQLAKGRKLKQKQQLKDSGEKVVNIVKKLMPKGDEEPEDVESKGAIVFNATSEFCRTLGEIPTYGLSGNREEQDEYMNIDQDDDKSSNGDSESETEENLGWSTVNLDEEKKEPEFATSSTTILDEEPIVNKGLSAALHLCQNKGLLDTKVQKVARVKAPNKSLPSTVYCIEDKMAIDDKYSRREEYRGFTQEFKEKDNYKPDVKISYVDDSGRVLTPKEAFRQLSHRFHGKGSGKMKTEKRMKKLEEEALLKKMSSSDTPLGTVALLQEKQKSQKTPYIILSGSGKSMTANTITK